MDGVRYKIQDTRHFLHPLRKLKVLYDHIRIIEYAKKKSRRRRKKKKKKKKKKKMLMMGGL